MKNKKILSILIVAAFILISFSAIASARLLTEPRRSIAKSIEDTGTIFRPNSASAIESLFLIEGDSGHSVMDMHFDTYYPLNLPREYRQEGLRVGFIGKLSPFISVRQMIICIKYHALPILIDDIWLLDDPEVGSIAGYVWEQVEKSRCPPIENAKVTATLVDSDYIESNELIYETYTNEWGVYRINDMKPGNYEVIASHKEYLPERKHVIVEPNEETVTNFTLEKTQEEQVTLTLDTKPEDISLEVFRYDPEPIEILPTTDGKLHLRYYKGTSVTIGAEEGYEKYIFRNWEEDASGDKNPISIEMETDKTILAVYIEK